MHHTKHPSRSAKGKKGSMARKSSLKASWLTRIPGSQIWMLMTKPKKKSAMAKSSARKMKARHAASHKTSLFKTVQSKHRHAARGSISMSFFPTFTAMWKSLGKNKK
jgi:hypothetical protein